MLSTGEKGKIIHIKRLIYNQMKFSNALYVTSQLELYLLLNESKYYLVECTPVKKITGL